jgi:hypothetical protein
MSQSKAKLCGLGVDTDPPPISHVLLTMIDKVLAKTTGLCQCASRNRWHGLTHTQAILEAGVQPL